MMLLGGTNTIRHRASDCPVELGRAYRVVFFFSGVYASCGKMDDNFILVESIQDRSLIF